MSDDTFHLTYERRPPVVIPETSQIDVEAGSALEQLLQVVTATREAVEMMAGQRGALEDRAVTFADLIRGGFTIDPKSQVPIGAPSNGQVIDFPGIPEVSEPDPTDLTTPPTPTGLTGVGTPRTVILTWDKPKFNNPANYAYTEVFANSTDNQATAVKVGQPYPRMFAHAVGATGVTRFYWIRHVSVAGVEGPFQAVNGLSVTTGTAAAGAASQAVDELRAVYGVIVQALIGDAEIDTAQIRDLAVKDAKIESLGVAKLAAGAMQVTSFIRSANYQDGVSGFQIHGNGNAQFWNIVARGDIQASNVSAGGTISAPNINGGVISGALVTGGTISGTTINGATINGGVVTGGAFRGNIYYSNDNSRYLDFDPIVGGYYLYTPNAKIRQNGQTEFVNTVASGTWSGETDNFVVTIPGQPLQWVTVFIDTDWEIPQDGAVYEARANVTNTIINGGPGPGNLVGTARVDATVMTATNLYQSGAPPVGQTTPKAVIRADIHITHPANQVTIRVTQIQWWIRRVT